MKKDNLKRDINFFESIFKDKTKKTRDMEKDIKTSVKIFVGVACLAVVVLGAQIGFNIISTNNLKAENEALASPEKLEEIAENKAKAEALAVQNEKLKTKLQEIDAMTKLTMEDIGDVAYNQPTGIQITGVSYKEGEIKLACQGANELIGSYFAQSLRNSEKFADVIYTGTIQVSDNLYTAEVTVILPVDESATAEGSAEA